MYLYIILRFVRFSDGGLWWLYDCIVDEQIQNHLRGTRAVLSRKGPGEKRSTGIKYILHLN